MQKLLLLLLLMAYYYFFKRFKIYIDIIRKLKYTTIIELNLELIFLYYILYKQLINKMQEHKINLHIGLLLFYYFGTEVKKINDIHKLFIKYLIN